MKFNTLVKTVIIASLLFGAVCQADNSGMATGKRQHKPTTVTKEIDKATPKLASPVANGKNESDQKVRAGYRLCPDGTMINPGEKCPEKSAKK